MRWLRSWLQVLLAITLVGCSLPNHASSTAPLAATAPKPLVNWFVDKDGNPVPKGYVNWEAEKQQKKIPTDLIVIHHTAAPPGMSWLELSDIQYKKLYVGRYQIDDPDPMVNGWTPHSGHYRMNGPFKEEVFYAYHWLVRADGSTERLLHDNEVGWNCDDWDKNMRSIAICLDGNFVDASPSAPALQTVGRLIKAYQKKFPIKDVIGHKDTFATDCPGSWWPGGKRGLFSLAPPPKASDLEDSSQDIALKK